MELIFPYFLNFVDSFPIWPSLPSIFFQSIVVWDATVGRSQTVIDGHSKVIWSVDGSQDGLTILTSSSDKTARLWNTFTGQCERVFSGHTGPVVSEC